MGVALGLLTIGISVAVVFGIYRLINGALPNDTSRTTGVLYLIALSHFLCLERSLFLSHMRLRGLSCRRFLTCYSLSW